LPRTPFSTLLPRIDRYERRLQERRKYRRFTRLAACATKDLTQHRDLYGQVSRAVWPPGGERVARLPLALQHCGSHGRTGAGEVRCRVMLARVARYEVETQRIDDAVQAFGEAAGQIEELQGFAGGFVLVDPQDGRTMTVTLWENLATLENSEPVAGRARRQAAEAVDGSVLSVETFEVAHELGARGGS
jgi:heme-degrading monooxygenase HmoA